MSVTVNNDPPPAAPPAASPPAPSAADPPKPEGVSREEFEALKADLANQQRATEFWYDRATGKAKGGSPDEPAPAKPAEADPDLLDLITSGGAKAFDAYMKSRGYVSREELEATVNTRAQQIAKETELKERFPDLRRNDTPFFKETAKHYGALVKAGVPEAMAMELAAERAELDGFRTGKVKTPTAAADEQKAQQAAERKARAQAAQGDRGTRPAGEPDGGEDDELTDEQKRIADRMGVPHDKYKARAKAGVQMSAKIATR